MKIHEYQAKELFRKAGVAVLQGRVASTPAEAAAAFTELGRPLSVIKAQVHAGGRGKGTILENPDQRGVQLVRSAAEAEAAAKNMLGNHLKTIQTGPDGSRVNRVFIEEGCQIERELYLGIVLDRERTRQPVLMVSSEGGVEIEKVAEETPHLIHMEPFDPRRGLKDFQVRKLCAKLGLKGKTVQLATKFMKALCRLYVDLDCSLAEINPLVITKDGEVIALDGKVTFDDNGLIRHKELLELRDLAEEAPSEVEASDAGLSFIKLDGNIACLVNGAGLAMATMDIIKLHGGEPANFLDVGGGASVEKVTKAFRIILSDPNVKAILVNIFGGIQKCTTIAEAIIAASKAVGFNVPLVVRLEGTLVEEGKKLLADSGVKLITADGLTDAAQKVVAATRG
jgi:succinyl-CoA synthetase beta subunit